MLRRVIALLMVVIANWPRLREAHWLALARSRAIENQCYFLAVNRTGDDPHIAYGGKSLLVDPQGETVVEAGAGRELVGAEVVRQVVLDWRQQFPALADIREEMCGK